MRLQKFGHACLLVEQDGARLLLDPGTFSAGFEALTGLTAVLVTHQHPDHLDVARLRPLLQANPQAAVHTDEGSAGLLAEQGIQVRAVHDGDVLDLGVDVRVVGRDHAVIHPDIPTIPNVGYLIGGRLFHPGDAFTLPPTPVEVLGLPTAAPWLKLAEAVDYLRAVGPRLAVPIHEAVLARPQMHYGRFEELAPAGTQVRVIDDGEPLDI